MIPNNVVAANFLMTSSEFLQIERPRQRELALTWDNWFVYASPPMRKFADAFCQQFGLRPVCEVQRDVFSNGCPNLKIFSVPEIMTHVGGANVIFFHAYRSLQEKKIEEMLLFVLTETVNVERLVVVDPFDPWATMERVTSEGEVASANIDAHFWKTLPTCSSGRKVQRLIYDQHTLQNRFFYQGGNTAVSYRSGVPLFRQLFAGLGWQPDGKHAMAFPDDGACKRFGKQFPGFELIICGKRRGENDSRIVTILDGDCKGRHVCVVDDLVRSGGTLLECAKALLDHEAAAVSFFVVHAEFPQESWRKFLPDKCPIPLQHFFVTDSCADVTAQLQGKIPFRIVSLAQDIKHFLDVMQ